MDRLSVAGFKTLPSGEKLEGRDGHTHSVCDLCVTHSLCDSVLVSTCLCSHVSLICFLWLLELLPDLVEGGT